MKAFPSFSLFHKKNYSILWIEFKASEKSCRSYRKPFFPADSVCLATWFYALPYLTTILTKDQQERIFLSFWRKRGDRSEFMLYSCCFSKVPEISTIKGKRIPFINRGVDDLFYREYFSVKEKSPLAHGLSETDSPYLEDIFRTM